MTELVSLIFEAVDPLPEGRGKIAVDVFGVSLAVGGGDACGVDPGAELGVGEYLVDEREDVAGALPFEDEPLGSIWTRRRCSVVVDAGGDVSV